jgi:hypothetical protein
MEKLKETLPLSHLSIENWDQADFITYLYLLMADADCEITDNEKLAIHEDINRIIGLYYPEKNYEYERSLPKVREAVISHQLKAWDVIPSLLERLHLSAEVKRHILQDLTELMSADEEVTTPEYNTLLFIRRYFAEAA